jgi:hypothetical protein
MTKGGELSGMTREGIANILNLALRARFFLINCIRFFLS